MSKKIYTPYGEKPKAIRTYDPEENRTQTVPTSETDVNEIIARSKRGMSLEALTQTKIPVYQDNTLVGTFEEVQNHIADMKTAFEHLPATVREELDNNPSNMAKAVMSDDPEIIKFCAENNIGEVFGIEYKDNTPVIAEPTKVEIVNPAEEKTAE